MVLGLLIILVVLLSFRWGYWILGNDNYSPEQNPAVSFERYLTSPTWRTYRGLGVPSDSEQIDIFRSGLFLALEKIGIPLWLVSQMSVWVAFGVGVWGMGWFLEKFYKKQEAFLAGGMIYLSSILTLWLFFSPLKPFIFFWGFLPMFLAMSVELLEKDSARNWMGWLAVMVAFSGSFVIPTLFLVSLLVLIFMGGVLGLRFGKWRKMSLLLGIFLVWQLYWLISFGVYVNKQSEQLQNSFINRAITSGTIQDEKEFGGNVNILRFLTSWVETKDDNGQSLFVFNDWYRGIWGIVLGFIPLLLTVWGWSKKKWVWVIMGMAGLGAWLLVNSNPPLGWFYNWCSRNIPLFMQVFRWGSSKFWIIWWLPVVILATGGWLRVWRWRRVAAIIILGGLLIYVYPVFLGKLINDRDWVKIPSEYYDLREYLGKIDTEGRVYLAPEANMLYFRNYDWGFFGSVFWSYWIPNPIIEKALITGSIENEKAFNKIVNLFYSDGPILFTKILNNAGVEWVIGDKSVTNKGNGYKYNWGSFKEVVENNPYLDKIWSEGSLGLYKVKKLEPISLTEGENLLLNLGEGKMFGRGVSKISDGYRVNNQKETSGVYWEISNPELRGKLLRIKAEVENKSGVVAEINLRETKKQYQTFRYTGKMVEAEVMEGEVYLPSDWRNYLLEFVVKARGPDESVNTLKNLRVESVPLMEDYLQIEQPEDISWRNLRWVTYAGWVINVSMVVFLLVRQKLKSRKTSFSGNKKTIKA